MKKSIILLALFCVFVLVGCGSRQLVNDPVDDLYGVASQMKSEGAFAVVGFGESKRLDLARDKAIADCQRLIGEAMHVQVEALKKKFIEEVGSEDPEINEFFSVATKILTKAEYSGAVLEKTYRNQRKDGNYEFFAVMALNKEIIVKSMDDELKNRKMYERFRASEAFKEMDNQIDNYEQSQLNSIEEQFKKGVQLFCTPLFFAIEKKMKILARILFFVFLMLSLCFAAKRYPEWFVHPRKYPKIVVGYNYRDVSVDCDAAATYCVLNHCVVKGELYQYINTEKRYSDYHYYYDQEDYNSVLDSLNYLKTYVVNTFPLSLIAAFSMDKYELNDICCDFTTMERPVWVEKNFYRNNGYYYGIGVYTSSGNDMDAWKTAEERSFFAIVIGFKTGITSKKMIFKDSKTDYYSREQVLHCQYSLIDLQICERYADKENKVFYVLSRIDKTNIKAGKLLEE